MCVCVFDPFDNFCSLFKKPLFTSEMWENSPIVKMLYLFNFHDWFYKVGMWNNAGNHVTVFF